MFQPQNIRQSQDDENPISIFRCAALSRKKPATIKQLLHDYYEITGDVFNFKKYGFNSVEDFLQESDEFLSNNIHGEMYYTPRPNERSEHIRKMLTSQRPSKSSMTNSKRSHSSLHKVRQPKKSDQSWNKSSYSSNVFEKLPLPKKHLKLSAQKNNNNSGTGNGNRDNKNYNQVQKSGSDSNNNTENNQNIKNLNNKSSNFHPEQVQQNQAKSKLSSRFKSFATASSNNTKNTQLDDINRLKNISLTNRQTNTIKKDNLFQPSSKNINNYQQEQNIASRNKALSEELTLRPANLGQKSIQDRFYKQQTTSQSQISVNDDSNTVKKSAQSRLFSSSTPEYNSPNTIKSNPMKKSIQSRLFSSSIPECNSPNVIKNNSSAVINEPEKLKDLNEIKEEIPTSPSSLTYSFQSNVDSVLELEQYCKFYGFESPTYKFLKSKFTSKIHGRVLVNGITYSTYPNDFDSENEAKYSTASKAIEEIKAQEMRCRFPICMDSNFEISLMIYQEVRKHSNGVFFKNISELFERAYKKKLPDNWFAIIEESNMFVVEILVGGNMIVLAKEDAAGPNVASDDLEIIVIDKISLPWENKYWNIYTTYCASTVEIWARIVDKGYNDKLDSLMNDIDVYMLTEKKRPVSIVCGQLYLVSISECWHRVRVEEMNKESGKCLCFFIDFGDEEWQSMDQLYICEPKFLMLPPQAICFSLFGLEDFAENPNAKKHLSNLTGRTLVAEILTKKEDYEINNSLIETTNENTKIRIALYDTSTNEDINLNPEILNQICEDTESPELKRNGVNNVYITHIQENGDIYLQLKSLELQYVQKLIQQLAESKFKKDQLKCTKSDIKKSKLYFIQDPDTNRWYRSTLFDNNNDNDLQLNQKQKNIILMNDNYFNMFYIDYGITKKVPLTNIYRLDSLSTALSKFPKQAIKVRLYKLPPVNDKIVTLLRGFLPIETSAIVKVSVNAIIPQVMIYKRFDGKDGLCNINDSILIEYELESSSEINSSNTQSKSNGSCGDNSSSSISALTIQKSDSGTMNYGPTNNNNISRIVSLRSQQQITVTVPNSPQKELSKLSENQLPKPGEYFDVIVTMASNPNNFTVRPYSDGPKLVEMMSELKSYCLSNDEFIPFDMIEEGQAYAAYNSDGFYYRVTVETKFINTMEIHVHYCDFGGVAILSNDKLKTLPAKFRILPKQAISAKLSGIEPKHGDWSLQDCVRFQSLTAQQKFVSIVKNITDDPVTPDTKIVELQLIDVKTNEDVYVHEIMINEDRAVRC